MAIRRKELTDTLVVRVPKSLREALERDAEDNGRTVAQSVRFHLTRAVRVHADRADRAPRGGHR